MPLKITLSDAVPKQKEKVFAISVGLDPLSMGQDVFRVESSTETENGVNARR